VPALGELSDDAVHVELETKVLGYPRCARAVAPFMIEQGWGRINNISGLSARQSGSLVGSVRNVAVSAMTKNLADELGPAGINVTVVHPGVTVTGRTPGMVADRAHRDGLIEAEVHARLAAASSIGSGQRRTVGASPPRPSTANSPECWSGWRPTTGRRGAVGHA
jgi:NAD(P)-dependent dehydrogenase (short-subunit alcohol dehydrogenase family)